ncbi:class I SAM-dependent methyltransferase [Yoonia litorea]|uniref:Ubiquinone/menaquinone biosynthesis C-methylase UbiE n=1 Tax=Yoonia litorea TaxID=1123755 RepID=A0A1I6LB88_9RHOB|nr:class I SAM-dependent methyltransferase [Yoonia litorea]SFS00742.1 Ubiquinone/menaquinone biosynthesis C-methylase UbiE [Yoonia litorea]
MSTADFWDKAAEKYAASKIKDENAYEDTLERTRGFLKKDDHLLEVGCGTGTTALKLAKDVARITATDVSSGMLDIAEKKRQDAGVENVHFIKAEVMTDMPDAPFDAVFASSILHLVDDLDATLAHLFSLLKPGGYMVSKTTCLKQMSILIPPMIKVMQAFGKAPAVLVFSADELESAFTRAGFTLIETRYFGKNRAARFIVAKRPQ